MENERKVFVRVVQKRGRNWEMLCEKKVALQGPPNPDSQTTLMEDRLDDETPILAARRVIKERFGGIDSIFTRPDAYALIHWPGQSNDHLLCMINRRAWEECVEEVPELGGDKKGWVWMPSPPPVNLKYDALLVG